MQGPKESRKQLSYRESIEEFSAEIHKLGINPFVDVPVEIVTSLLQEANKKSTPVQVKVTLNGKGLFETSVLKYQGSYILYLNMQMRKEAGVGFGDSVCVTLKYDSKLRMPPMPEQLEEALSKNKLAKEKWRIKPNSKRKEVLAYLNSLKSEDSIKRVVGKVIRILLDE
jgi:hypothetical protein